MAALTAPDCLPSPVEEVSAAPQYSSCAASGAPYSAVACRYVCLFPSIVAAAGMGAARPAPCAT